MSKARLDKILSEIGYGSRKQVKNIILNGRVRCNDVLCLDVGAQIDRELDKLSIDGQYVDTREFIYIMLNKPEGVVSATRDNLHDTVIELIPKEFHRAGLAPVGRLDIDTTGFIILTNDGQFAHRVISPSSNLEKIYIAEVDAPLVGNLTEKFKDGIVLSDGYRCKPAKFEIISEYTAKIIIFEGKYHQIKRMLASVGYRVQTLKRIAIGSCELDKTLQLGQCRALTKYEIELVVQNK